jgi:DNA-binding YbaB/EbfC family protein
MNVDAKLTAVYLQVPEGYIGFVEELPGANTQGTTLEETKANLAEAIQLVLEANRTLAEDKQDARFTRSAARDFDLSGGTMEMNKKMLGDLMQQAQALQGKMARLQEEAALKTTEATSGGGMVTVTINGRQEVLTMILDPEVVRAGDVQMLQDLIIAAVNEAIRNSQQMVANDMKDLGISIPGM